ncbi:Wzz/FepE/Etk N-terminal domain-containing protein [Streptomyces sp. NPDC087300]|uniref:Wzz/FepE/Etk N-terminal domain-containing protein n=1 Tax=Streptomyces sp. NPDC087300 TaxID=3365780 RepID=UPI00380E8955
MSEDTIRLVTIGRIFRRRWRLLVTVAVVGALVGYGASLVFPPSYTTSTSVVLAGQWEERELLTQTEIAASSAVIDRSAGALDWKGVSGSDLKDQVSATAADGNIIKISGTAETPERAQQLSDQVAKDFVTFAARLAGDNTDADTAAGPEALRQKVVKTNQRISDLANAADPGQTVEGVQARTELEKLRTALQEAMKKLDEADPATNKANMVVMGPAALPTGEAPPTRPQLVAAGALLFFLFAVIGHLTAARVSRRLRTEPEIAAALGSALIGTVDVPGERSAHKPEGHGPGALVRRFLGLDTRWDVPAPQPSGGEGGRQIRYRRVCARLRDRLPAARQLLVVVPEGDEIAHRAAEQLVVEARNDPAASTSHRGYPVLRVVEVPVNRPLVPDRDTESGVLVVLSAGGWTAAELAGIAEACGDAGHQVVGTVVAGAVRAPSKRTAGRPARPATPALAVGDDLRGGAG